MLRNSIHSQTNGTSRERRPKSTQYVHGRHVLALNVVECFRAAPSFNVVGNVVERLDQKVICNRHSRCDSTSRLAARTHVAHWKSAACSESRYSLDWRCQVEVVGTRWVAAPRFVWVALEYRAANYKPPGISIYHDLTWYVRGSLLANDCCPHSTCP
jgi:hypothetical protein